MDLFFLDEPECVWCGVARLWCAQGLIGVVMMFLLAVDVVMRVIAVVTMMMVGVVVWCGTVVCAGSDWWCDDGDTGSSPQLDVVMRVIMVMDVVMVIVVVTMMMVVVVVTMMMVVVVVV